MSNKSVMGRLQNLEVGECFYFETTKQKYPVLMRGITTPESRQPKEMKGRKFSTSLIVGVGVGVGEVLHLVRAKRIK